MQHEIEAIVAHAKTSPPAKPEEPVLVAGDPERISKKERQVQGIPIDDATWEQILECGETLGLTRKEMMNLAVEGPGYIDTALDTVENSWP